MDVTNLKFTSNLFDLIIDKGTFDAVSCSDSCFEQISAMLV